MSTWLCQDCLLPSEQPDEALALAGTPSEPRCACGGELCWCDDCERAARIVQSGATLAERLRLARAGGVALADEYAKKGPLG